jgi:hypothetical protein
MTKDIKITYTQEDIRVLISNDLFDKGYTAKTMTFQNLVNTVTVPFPEGAKKDDVISVLADVKEKKYDRDEEPGY